MAAATDCFGRSKLLAPCYEEEDVWLEAEKSVSGP